MQTSEQSAGWAALGSGELFQDERQLLHILLCETVRFFSWTLGPIGRFKRQSVRLDRTSENCSHGTQTNLTPKRRKKSLKCMLWAERSSTTKCSIIIGNRQKTHRFLHRHCDRMLRSTGRKNVATFSQVSSCSRCFRFGPKNSLLANTLQLALKLQRLFALTEGNVGFGAWIINISSC